MDNSWTYNNIYSRFVKIYAQSDFEVIVDKVTGVNYLRYQSGSISGGGSFSGSGSIPPGGGDYAWGDTSSRGSTSISGTFWAITPLLNRDGTPLCLTRDVLERLRNGELPKSSI